MRSAIGPPVSSRSSTSLRRAHQQGRPLGQHVADGGQRLGRVGQQEGHRRLRPNHDVDAAQDRGRRLGEVEILVEDLDAVLRTPLLGLIDIGLDDAQPETRAWRRRRRACASPHSLARARATRSMSATSAAPVCRARPEPTARKWRRAGEQEHGEQAQRHRPRTGPRAASRARWRAAHIRSGSRAGRSAHGRGRTRPDQARWPVRIPGGPGRHNAMASAPAAAKNSAMPPASPS